MELIKRDKSWFLSEEGGNTFTALETVGDRAVYIYSYLKTFVNESFEENNVLFKTSFLIADSILNSDVSYSKFPELLDEKANPYIAFLANANRKYTIEQIYCIFLSFIHNIADPFQKTEWIYNETIFKDNGFIHKIDEMGHMFVIPNKDMLVNPSAYKCDEVYNLIQLEIIWLFGER